MSQTQKQRRKVKANTPTMVRIGAWFGRRESTLWTLAESEALADLEPIPAEELELLEKWYREPERGEPLYRRKAPLQLLNNWPSECDKARAHFGQNGHGRKSNNVW